MGDFRKRLASLKTLSDGFQDPSQGYVKQSLKNYQSLSDWLDRAGAAVEKAEDDATAKADAAKSGGATSGGAATPATKPGAPLDFQSKRMIGFFDKDHYRYQAWFEGPLEAKKVADYKAALAKLENWYSKIPPAGQAHPEGQKRKAVVEAIRSKIDSELGDVKILPDADKQLLGQFKSLYQRNSFKIDGAASNPLSLQDPAEKARIEKLLAMVREPLDKVSMKDHPDVKKQMARLKPLEEALAKGVAQGAAMADEAGDIDAQIAMMKKTFPYRTFDPSFPGGDAEAVAGWAERLKAWEEGAEEGYAWLEKVEKLTLAAKEQDFKDYKSWFRAGPGRAIKNAKDEVVKGWFSKSRAALMNVNPNIGNMSKSAATATANRLESVVPDLERLIAYQRVYEGKVDEEFSGGKKKIEDVVAKIRGDVATRAGRARMPEARGAQGQELLTIARETLGREKYGVGEIRGLRIRSGKESSTRVEYWDGKWWTKDWDEFHVAFAAKDGGKWFIKYADIRFYRKGFRTTPTGKWIVAKMFGDREILEENIGK